MIRSVTIQNFKNIREQTIDLDRLTVFVGANASGKTSVLEAIHLAVRAAMSDPAKVFRRDRHCDWLYTRGGVGELSISCGTHAGRFTIKASPPAGFPPPLDLMGCGAWTFDLSSPDGFLDDPRRLARPPVFLHLNAPQLARPSYSDRDPPRLEHDGEGLASVLAYMALNDRDAFDELVDFMRELIPQIKRIRFRKARVKRSEKELVRFGNDTVERRTRRSYQGDAILFDLKNGDNVAAHTLSEGTLLLLGLVTVLLDRNQPRMLLMDDLEHGLHPLAQKTMVATIGTVMNKFPDMQVLATAHSPYLLDHLKSEQIRLLTIGADGYSVCGRLENHPQFQKWKDEMAPGELWSLFGEKWIAEGAVAP